MINLTVPKEYDNKKLSKFIFDTFPKLSFNEFQKTLRKKDFKINDIRINTDTIIHENDNLSVYIIDSILYGTDLNLNIIYEDDNILIINKPQGIPVTKQKNSISVMNLVEKYYNNTLAIPCHRLDTNTSGLLIIAKNNEALEILLSKFKTREIQKFYKATVYGIPKQKTATLKAYLFKDSKKSLVYISDTKKQGYIEIITKYKVLSENKQNNTSILEVELITGKTHQIRAHLAYIRIPYNWRSENTGDYNINKKFKCNLQMLQSYKLIFNFNTPSGILEYLKGKEFII